MVIVKVEGDDGCEGWGWWLMWRLRVMVILRLASRHRKNPCASRVHLA